MPYGQGPKNEFQQYIRLSRKGMYIVFLEVYA
jgi:hypothetical protein